MPDPAIDAIMSAAVEHHQAGRLTDAEAGYQQVLAQVGWHPQALHMMGMITLAKGEPARAIDLLRESIRGQLGNPDPYLALGVAFERTGDIASAHVVWSTAIQLDPNLAEAHFQMGRSLAAQGRLDPAITGLRRALELNSENVAACVLLGNAYRERGRLDESISILKKAIEIDHSQAGAYAALANTYSDQSRLDEARTANQKAMQLAPDAPAYHSSVLCGMYFDPHFNGEQILPEHRSWNQRYAQPLSILCQPRLIESLVNRRVRVAYLSPDFRIHPVGRFLLPMLQKHNREKFEVHAYFTGHITDSMTDCLRAAVEHWHACAHLSDEALAEQIRNDRIDILIELSLHSAYNRLLVLARKPAPVQVTWLGYPGTTGMDAVDYRFSDPYLDPSGGDDDLYAEKTIRLPVYWCYPAPADAPPVTSSPSQRQGLITFGCLNHFMKVNRPLLEMWIAILLRVERSRLLLHSKPGGHWKTTLAIFARAGIEANRVSFIGIVPMPNYFRQYNNIDIALDTAPYAGGTTTCDALYMGVPVVTLRGKTAVGRMGVSILSNLQLEELIAETADQYIQIAADLAAHTDRLAALRATLRDRMTASPLMNAAAFTAGVESALEAMASSLSARPSTNLK